MCVCVCVSVCLSVGLSGCEHAQCSILASDNLGYVARFDACCKLLDRWKLHKGKVSSVEYNPIDHNIFATTSVDRTCSLWDLRMLRKGANPGGKGALLQPLLSQSYGGAVTGATFSRNGQRLMVTSQDNKVSVYNVSVDTHGVSLLGGLQPGWDGNCLQIEHPHRFYQHLTQHRATFHPRSNDLFIIGRFPEKVHPKPETRNPKPETRHPKPETLNGVAMTAVSHHRPLSRQSAQILKSTLISHFVW
jgi:WD40 repeat protein